MAFAALLVRSGFVTERQLSQATSRWTTHGTSSLAKHLVSVGLISTEHKEKVQAAADKELKRVESELNGQGSWTRTQQDRHWLDRLDPGGKLAKLLGFADASVLAPEEIESRQIGARYTLLRRLGQGGIGTVWLARDENLQRYVAVKEIRNATAAAETAEAHFRREAEITGKLEHPGIVPVYQFGTDEATGRSFYAMRFLGKRTLQDAIAEYHERREAGNEDRLLKHRLLTAFVNVCQAVAHAHSRKVIHRDLKPENIAIDSFGQIVLLDWGLAKINDESGMYEVKGQPEPGDLHSIGSTHTGRVLGTPLYMAPEQAAGRLEEVDELTDVYGLGGVLYAILTGEGPHQRGIESRNGGASGGASEVLSAIVSSEITPPNKIVDGVPPELNAICMKALSNKRYLRYGSATVLAEDIEHYRAGSPVSAYETPTGLRAKRWMAAHPTLTQVMLLLATLTILGGAAIGYIARQGRLAVQAEKYKSLQEFVRELETNLQFETQELVQDVRFLTDFPLTRAVTATQLPETVIDGKLSDGQGEIDLSSTSPEEWLERQGRLMDGILEANPGYLVASSVRFENPNMTELVRSERLSAGMRPRRVPKEQLYEGAHPESDSDFYGLRPGEVVLTTGDQLAEKVPTKNRSPLVVVAIGPIFDEAGKFFGINVIELDLRRRLEELFQSSRHDDVEIFVAGGAGDLAMEYRNGRATRPVTSTIQAIPKLTDFATNSEEQFGDGKFTFASKVRLGRDDSPARLAIIARIVSEDD